MLILLTFLGAVSYSGWYVLQAHSLNTQRQKALSASANPYAGWTQYSNGGNEFRFLYPPNWSIEPVSTGAPDPNLGGKYGTLLQIYDLKTPKHTIAGYIREYYAAPSDSPNAVLSHVLPNTTLTSQRSLLIGGVSANHEFEYDQYTQYDVYVFWHSTIELRVVLEQQSKPIPNFTTTAADNTAYTAVFSQLARSICFADKYSSGQCINSR